jgi:uncharacterized protein (TIGR03437 family)
MRRTSLLAFLMAPLIGAQGVITTIAGTAFAFPSQPLSAINAPLGFSPGLAQDGQGNVYVADSDNCLVLKIDPQGTLSTVAGNGVCAFSGDDGPATSAALNTPFGVAVDRNGYLYISDFQNFRVRKVSPAGTISTLIGTGTDQTNNGVGPFGLAIDSDGNLLVADNSFDRILKVTPAGAVTTVASVPSPSGIAAGPGGKIYVSDFLDHKVFVVTTGSFRTFAGNGRPDFSGDGGSASTAALNNPRGLFADAAGNVYIADLGNNRIRMVDTAGKISTVAGSGNSGFAGDGGPALSASLNRPAAVLIDANGNLVFADGGNGRVRRVSPDQRIATIAGNGNSHFSGEGTLAASASLNLSGLHPGGIAVDRTGNLFIADARNNRVRRVALNGVISTIAGNGTAGFSGDGGPALSAGLNDPWGVAIDLNGNVLIADTSNYRVRKVDSSGLITTIAGNGESRFKADGVQATTTGLAPKGIAVDSVGNILVADQVNSRVRKISPAGIISTLAGNGDFGESGDGGPATAAAVDPAAVAVDQAGNVFIADENSQRVRKIALNGTISAFAGNGDQDFSGDGGPATSAALFEPVGVATDAAGNVFIAEYFNHRIRRVSPSGIISTVAGNGNRGFSGDGGPAVQASLNTPQGVAVDSAGNLFIADTENNRIREVLVSRPRVQAAPVTLFFSAASAGAVPPIQIVDLSSTVPAIAFSLSSDSDWLRATPQSGFSPRVIEVSADPANLKPGSYKGTLTITAPDATPTSLVINVSFTVSASQPPVLSIDKGNLSFPFPNKGKARSETLNVSNNGGGTLLFNASAKTNTGGNWLSVSPASGQVSPSAPVPLTVTADPLALLPGTYTGSVTLTGASDTQTVVVVMTVSAGEKAILLSKSGLSFLGVSQGGITAPQTFSVINIGSGIVHWTVTKSTLTGNPDWLQVGTNSGSTDASASTVPSITVSANPSILAPGKYYGLVRVESAEADNSPQVVTIFLQVLAAGSAIGVDAEPAELLFVTQANSGSPGSQDLLLYNVAADSKSFRSSVIVDGGVSVAVVPLDGTLDPKQPLRVLVQPLTDGLAPGLYRATLTLQFSDGLVRVLRFSVVVPSQGKASKTRLSAGGSCQATQLLPALSTPGQSFALSAGWPVGLGVYVTDDCGNPLDSGSVRVSFSNGDPPLSLESVKGGNWEATWVTGSAASSVVMRIQAADAQGILKGERQISGALQTQTDPPVFSRKGIVSSASGQAFQPLAPGSIVSIYGDRLAEASLMAPGAPLPNTLMSTGVLIGGRIAPLYFVSPTQLNAQVPFDLNVNTTHQVLIQRGDSYSNPIAVDVAPAQPGIFIDSSAAPNQGIIIAVRGQGTSQAQFEAKPGSPARAGDVVVIYCAGLGVVTPALPAGAAAGATLTAAVNSVQVTIGDKSAPVAFAGLTPGFVGLYQVNTTIPAGVASGNSVPVALSVAGQVSSAASIAVE